MSTPEALLDATRALADGLLRPDAEQVDRHGVPRSHLDRLADAGLFGIVAPPAYGGSELAPADARTVAELLAGADASTWFVWTQHHTPVRTLLRGENADLRDRLLPRLARGRTVAGVAFTHLRRPGAPSLVAARDGDGWTFTGRIDWLTSWRLADVFLVGAQAGDDVVWACLPLHERAGVEATPLALAAMGGTSTVQVELRDVQVSADEVVLVEPLEQWRASDAARTADVSPAVLGVVAETVRRLRERSEPAASEAAAAADRQLEQIRHAAYDLIDTVAAGEQVGRRLELRAAAHTLAVRAAASLVAAGGGRSMSLDAPAQRLARVALFLLVQGQTVAAREATLRELAQ